MIKAKKILSVFLAILMALSSLTVGLTAFAADEVKSYAGLDDNYQALAAALQKKYVTQKAEYIKGNNSYSAVDNELGEVNAAAQAFYMCITTTFDTNVGGSEKKLYNEAQTVSDKLKNAMGNDYTSKMEDIVRKYFTGLGDTQDIGNGTKCTFSVSSSIENALIKYDSLKEFPNDVANRVDYEYTQENVWIYYLVRFNKNEQKTNTNDIKNKINNFNTLYSATETEYEDLNADTKAKLQKDGQNIINNVSSFSKNFLEKFCVVSVADAQKYLDGYFNFSTKMYSNAIKALDEKCDNKKISDFDYTSLEQLKSDLDGANKLYNSFNNDQKNDVKSDLIKYNEYYQFYLNSYNYNVGVEYSAALDKAAPYFAKDYIIAKNELETVKSILDDSQKVYKKYSGKITDASVTDTKKALEERYKEYTNKYQLTVEKYEWEDYTANIQAIANQFKTCPSLYEINAISVVDDKYGNILKTAQLVADCSKFLFSKDKNTYNSMTVITDKMIQSLSDSAALGESVNDDVIRVIKFMVGIADSNVGGKKTFTVAPVYLEQYNSVKELPEQITYDVVTFTYDNESNGKLKSITKSSETKTDSDAYISFNLFKSVFTDDVLNSDINSIGSEQLNEIRSDGSDAINLVSVFDENTINRLLGNDFAKAQNIVAKCGEILVNRFNSSVSKLNTDFGDRKLKSEDVDKFNVQSNVIDAYYSYLNDDEKNSESVKTNFNIYTALKAVIKEVADETYVDRFADMVKELDEKYPKKDMTYAQYDGFCIDATKVNDYYLSLSDEAKALKKAEKAYEDLQEIVNNMEVVREQHFLYNFYAVAEKNLTPLYTGDLKNPSVVSFDIMGVSNIRTAINRVNAAYKKLSTESTAEEDVMLYMNIVANLQSKIDDLTASPKFIGYNVEYPNAITQAQINDIINRLSTLLESGMIDELLGGKSLADYVENMLNENLFTSNMVNTLINFLLPTVINAIPEYAGLLGMVGIQVYPNGVAGNNGMGDYPQTQKAIAAAGEDWSKVDWSKCDWVKSDGTTVHDVDTFCNALGSAFNGLVKFLKALFTGGDIGVLGQTIVTGNEGYKKDVLPFLELLGCDRDNGLKSYKEFQADREDARKMLADIIKPLINRVLEILEKDTVNELLGLLPDLAYVFNYNLISTGLTDLMSPLGKFGFDINAILKDNGIDLSDIIGTINGLLGDKGIEIPQLNWAQLAGIGDYKQVSSLRQSGTRNHIDPRKPDVLVYLLYYVVEVVHNNQSLVDSLTNKIDNATIKDLINAVVSNDGKTFVKALVTVLTPYNTPDYTWPEFDFSKTSVSYPNTYSAQDMDKLVNSLSGILNQVLELVLDGSLGDMLNNNVLTGAVASVLFNKLYSTLDNETVATVLSRIEIKDATGKTMTVDLTKDAVYKNLKSAGFKDAAKVVKKADSLKSAITTAEDWNIEKPEDFVDAVCAIVAPFNGVITALLAGKGYEVTALNVVELYGANGYNNAVKPLLDALGCNTISVAEYNEQAQKDSANALKNILLPFINYALTVVNNPLKSAIDVVPKASLFIDNGGIQIALKQLLAPLNNVFGGVAMLINTNDIYTWLVNDLLSSLVGVSLDFNHLQEQIIPLLNDKVLGNIKINDQVSLSLHIPNIDWSHFAGCMNETENGYQTVTADSATEIIRYTWSAVQNNKGEIDKLIKSLVKEDLYKTLSPIIGNVLKLNADEFIKVVMDVLNGLDASSFKADWSFLYSNYANASVKYPNGVTPNDITNLVNTLSSVLNNVLTKFLNGSLTDLVGKNLYTDSTITSLAKTVFSLGENTTVNTVLGVLGVDLSKEALVKALESDYKSVSKSIEKSDLVSKADTSQWNWKVTDKESFAKAFVAVLRPFEPLLNVLLNSGSISISDVVDFTGANGYANAVKPLLDVIGCDSLSISEYERKANINADNLLLNIINPLLNQVDRILKDPVNMAAKLLPQIANFVDKGGIQYAVECLLYPVANLVNPVLKVALGNGDIYSLLVNDLLSKVVGISLDWENIQNQIIPILNEKLLKNISIGKTKLSLVLPNIDWSKFGGCGRFSDGSINANVSDETVIILDYLWSVVQSNKSDLKLLIKSLVGADAYKTLSPYINKLFSANSDQFVKAIVNWIKGLDSTSFKADWSFLYKDFAKTTVSLPDGVTTSDLQQVVNILSEAINNALGEFLNKPLTSLVGDTLYKDSVITSLATTIYSLSENDTVVTVLDLLGCDFSKDAIASSLKSEYKSVYKSINKADKLSKADTSKWKWNVTDKASFAKALVIVLRPFEPVLNVLLNSGSISIADAVDFKGSNGYANAVKPLLDTLGCKTISASKYASEAKKNADNLLLNIINPLLNQVDAILKDPVNMAAKLLPQIANFIDKGGVQYAVECLLYPVIHLVNPILSLITDDNIFDFVFNIAKLDMKWSKLQYQVIPLLNKSLLSNLKIGDKKLSLLLPPLDWATLAGCGRLKGNSIKADTGKELISIIRYVFDVLDKNENALMKLLGGKNSTIGQIVKNVLNCGANGFVKIVVNILLKMDTFDNVSWMFKSVLQQATQYTENLGKEEYTKALNQIDPLISGLVSELAGPSLKGLATGAVYTNNIVNTLAKLIYTNLESLDIGIDLNMVFSIVDVDISTSGVAKVIKDYSSASKQIAKYSKWSDVNFDKISWGFKDGDRDGFVNALAAVLRPLYSVLRVVLSGDDLVALGSLHIKGGNGYNTAIIPIAEALDIDPENLVSPKQYAKDANSDKLITDILNPLLDKVEQILDSPVSSLSEMLPNLAYFVYNGGVKASVENLIAPVTRILKEIDPIYSVNIDLSMLDNIDIDSLVNSLIKDVKVGGKPLGIKISDIDLEKLAGRGSAVTYLSARTYNGNRMQAKRIVADKSAVFISVLRYLVENIKYNLDAINNLISGLDIPENIAGIINQILTALTTEDVDSVIEMLMDLLFGFGSGTPAIQPVDKTEEPFDPFNLGNYYWVYWVVFAGVTVIVGISLFLIFRKKKRKSKNLLDEQKEGVNV